MRMADVILLVAQLELTSLRNVVRMLHTLGNEEGLGDKVKVIVNRVGSDDSDITLAKGGGNDRPADLLADAQRLPARCSAPAMPACRC